jgi:hypothetical protein
MYGAWEQYLGLEHADTSPRKAHTTNQVWPLYLSMSLLSFFILLTHYCNGCFYFLVMSLTPFFWVVMFIVQNRHSFERPVKIYN